MEALFTNQIHQRKLENKVLLIPDPKSKRLILTIPSELLFISGRATLSGKSAYTVKQLTEILKGVKNSVEIVGHTDPTPISQENSSYDSNWELSLQRAVSLSQQMRKNGYYRPLHIRGLSSSLYTSLPKRFSEQQRLDISRRVDIIIYDKDEKFSERLGL